MSKLAQYSRQDLEGKTVKNLLEIAKCHEVVGRHDMRKSELIEAIIADQEKQEQADIVVEKTEQPADIERELAQDGGSEEWENSHNIACEVVTSNPKDVYINSAKTGMIIAFKVNDTKVISGMIEEIISAGKEFRVRTKNGVKFLVRRKNIVWVKTGDRWPKGVYLALKGEAVDGENRTAN